VGRCPACGRAQQKHNGQGIDTETFSEELRELTIDWYRLDQSVRVAVLAIVRSAAMRQK
jgi:hypothetical protein